MITNLSKSLLTVSSDATSNNSFSTAVKNTEIDVSTNFFTFGTTVFFEPMSTTTRQSGGIGFFTNANGTDGYFVRIKTSQTAGLYGDEVRIFKLKNGAVDKVFDDNITINKNIVGIQEGKTYKIDVFVKHTGTQVNIRAYINGSLIKAQDNTSVIAKSSNIALFTNLGKAHFDYAYAIKITENQFQSPVLTDIYKAQFSKALVNLAYGEFFVNGIEKIPSNTKDIYVEEFGSIAREIRYFKKRYEALPSIPKFTYENLNSNVKVLYSNLTAFESEIYAINNSGISTIVDSSLGTQISVLGNNIIKSSGIIYQEDQKNKFVAQEPIVFESEWMQSEEDAIQLSEFIKSQWSKSNLILNLTVFGNPVLSVYDIITISHDFTEISPTQRFIITNIKHSWSDGLETTITARSIAA